MKVTAIQQVFFGGTLYGPDQPLHEFEIPDEPTRKLTEKEAKTDDVLKSIAVKGEVPVAFSSRSMRPVDDKKEKAPESKATDKEGKTIPSGKASAKEKI